MKLPQSLNAYNVTKENIEEFKGLDHNERAQNGAWYDMENMTLDDYPVASVRNKRGIVTSDYENTISNNDLIIQTRRGAFDAAIVNGKVSLLQNCQLTRQDDNISKTGIEFQCFRIGNVELCGKMHLLSDAVGIVHSCHIGRNDR